ncbi:MAG: hypothetical protein ACYTDY_17330, partial [Planctomycetota bacterium]
MRGMGMPFGLAVAALVLGALLVIPRKPPDLGVQPPDLGVQPPRFRIPLSAFRGTIVRAKPDEPAWPVLRAAYEPFGTGGVLPRIWMVGREPGSLLPLFHVDRALERVIMALGETLTVPDLMDHYDPADVLELRISREGERVRYRWGRFPDPGVVRWGGGDVICGPRRDPDLSPLTRFLAKRRAIVFLEIGTG